MNKKNVKRCLAFMLALFWTQMLLAQDLDKSRITVNMENVTVKQFFDEVERQTKIEFLYNADELKNLPRITVKETNAIVRQVITKVLSGIGCEFKENEGLVLVKLKKKGSPWHAVSGYVLDNEQQPVIGAQIKVVGTKIMTVTDADGAFFFDHVLPEKARVQVTSIGMQTTTVPVKNNMIVHMK